MQPLPAVQSIPLAGPELRRAVRKARKHTLHIQPMVNARPGSREPTRLQDFSTTGIGLLHGRRLREGDEFLISLDMQDGAEVPLLYRVVHSRGLKNGLYAVGAELVRVMERASRG